MHVTEQERERERETECVKETDANGIAGPGRATRARALTNDAFVEGLERKHVIFVLQNPPFHHCVVAGTVPFL